LEAAWGTSVQQPYAAGSNGSGSPVVQGASKPAAGRSTMVFRGLRVRVGMHAGVPDDKDVTYNAAEARFHYTGMAMRLVHAVAGATAGGQVLLSDTAFGQLRLCGGCGSDAMVRLCIFGALVAN
jgi:hypothetical protein